MTPEKRAQFVTMLWLLTCCGYEPEEFAVHAHDIIEAFLGEAVGS